MYDDEMDSDVGGYDEYNVYAQCRYIPRIGRGRHWHTFTSIDPPIIIQDEARPSWQYVVVGNMLIRDSVRGGNDTRDICAKTFPSRRLERC